MIAFLTSRERSVIVEGIGSAHNGSSASLGSMFEDRKSVFVDLLKWDVPVLHGRFEFDEFDNEHATYILVTDETGDHRGSARLLPTTRPHLLGTLFPELCAGSPPTGPGIMEITRFCLSRRQNAAARRRTRNQLVSALCSHALASGIHTYTGVAEVAWLQQILAFGWACRPLGTPLSTRCGMIGALAIEIDERTPGLLAETGIWNETGKTQVALARAA